MMRLQAAGAITRFMLAILGILSCPESVWSADSMQVIAGTTNSVGTGQQPTNPPRLIIRADDMGFSHSGNTAILQTCKDGIATSVEVLVPSPWFPEAVELLNKETQVDVGIHLCLTSEWDNVKWRPLSECSSLRDADGYFFPMVFPNKNYPGRSVAEQKWKIEEVERELRAQIELGKKRIPRISHVSYHMGCNSLNNEVRALVDKLAVEYQIAANPEKSGVKNVGFKGPRRTSAEKIDSFLKMLDGLEPGSTYLFVEHPGLDTPELRAIHHIGSLDVASDRQGVTDVFISPDVKAAIKAKGIQLIGYRDL